MERATIVLTTQKETRTGLGYSLHIEKSSDISSADVLVDDNIIITIHTKSGVTPNLRHVRDNSLIKITDGQGLNWKGTADELKSWLKTTPIDVQIENDLKAAQKKYHEGDTDYAIKQVVSIMGCSCDEAVKYLSSKE